MNILFIAHLLKQVLSAVEDYILTETLLIRSQNRIIHQMRYKNIS